MLFLGPWKGKSVLRDGSFFYPWTGGCFSDGSTGAWERRFLVTREVGQTSLVWWCSSSRPIREVHVVTDLKKLASHKEKYWSLLRICGFADDVGKVQWLLTTSEVLSFVSTKSWGSWIGPVLRLLQPKELSCCPQWWWASSKLARWLLANAYSVTCLWPAWYPTGQSVEALVPVHLYLQNSPVSVHI